MADTFNTGIQIPNIPEGNFARNSDQGYIRIYGRGDKVFGRLPDGSEVELTNTNVETEGFPVFVQDTLPETQSEKYLWIQTNIDGSPDNFTIFFEDGQ